MQGIPSNFTKHKFPIMEDCHSNGHAIDCVIKTLLLSLNPAILYAGDSKKRGVVLEFFGGQKSIGNRAIEKVLFAQGVPMHVYIYSRSQNKVPVQFP